jgi:predicted XRE-type DNA-binding protein
LPDPQGRLAKAQLATSLVELIRDAGLTQQAAAARLGIDQPKVSALMRGQLKGFSTERLLRFVLAMDRDVIITIGPARPASAARVRVKAMG